MIDRAHGPNGPAAAAHEGGHNYQCKIKECVAGSPLPQASVLEGPAEDRFLQLESGGLLQIFSDRTKFGASHFCDFIFRTRGVRGLRDAASGALEFVKVMTVLVRALSEKWVF